MTYVCPDGEDEDLRLRKSIRDGRPATDLSVAVIVVKHIEENVTELGVHGRASWEAVPCWRGNVNTCAILDEELGGTRGGELSDDAIDSDFESASDLSSR